MKDGLFHSTTHCTVYSSSSFVSNSWSNGNREGEGRIRWDDWTHGAGLKDADCQGVMGGRPSRVMARLEHLGTQGLESGWGDVSEYTPSLSCHASYDREKIIGWRL